MIHKNIYEIYKEIMPSYADRTEVWFPCGLNAIRVRLHTREEFIFSYSEKRTWSFETLNSYIKKMKKEKNKCNA